MSETPISLPTPYDYIETHHPEALREAMEFSAGVDGNMSELLTSLVAEIARLNVVLKMARDEPDLFDRLWI